MKILIDECLPKGLAKMLPRHVVKTAVQMGWSGISNGQLLRRACDEKFDVFITVDKNISSQKGVRNSTLAIVVLRAHSNRIQDVAPFAKRILLLLAEGITPKVHVLDE